MPPDDTIQLLDQWTNLALQRSAHDNASFSHQYGLSIGQVNVLLWFYHHGPLEISALCDRLSGVSKAAASQMVERMVQEGLVERKETPQDRRVRLVTLTSHGQELAEQCLAQRSTWLSQIVSSLSEIEQEHLQTALKLLLAATEKSKPEVHK